MVMVMVDVVWCRVVSCRVVSCGYDYGYGRRRVVVGGGYGYDSYDRAKGCC